MLNVLIAAVLWGSSGVCAQYIMEQSQMSSQFLTMTRLIFAGLILLTLSFVHGDKIFSIINNHVNIIKVSALIPGVLGTTGIETLEIIKGVVKLGISQSVFTTPLR